MKWIRRGLLLLIMLALAASLGFRAAAALREAQTRDALMPAEGRLVATSEGQIFVLEKGPPEAPLLLFAHGTAAWSGLWQPVLEEMGQQGWRAVAFDMPPFGYSDHAADGDYSREAQARRLLALVESLGTRPILVAHSVGAGPGVEAVMRAPGAFAGLVVVDGAIGLGSHESGKRLPLPLRNRMLREIATAMTLTNPWMTKTFLRGLIHRTEAATDARVELLTRPFSREGTTRSYAAWLPSLLKSPRAALSTRAKSYAALTLPVAYIWGEEDTVTPLSQGEELARITPGALFVKLSGIGHIPQIEDPAAFTLALTRTLGSIAADISR